MLTAEAQPNYDMQQIKREHLNRGVVAIRRSVEDRMQGKNGQQVIVSWRTLTSDTKEQPFDIYRNGEKLNREPLTKGGTFFIDDNPSNVEGAVYLGIHGIVYNQDPEQLREKLRELGIRI